MDRLSMVMLLSMLVLGGCSSSANPNAPVGTAAHEPGWLMTHGAAARQDLTSCQVCHGVSFTGNGRIPSCFKCHLGGPPFFIHPPSPEPALQWRHPVNHGAVAKTNLIGCQGCHGRPGGPGSNPRFDVALGPLEQGCESAVGCHDNTDLLNIFNNGHNQGAAHPVFDPTDLSKQDRRHWYGENIAYRTSMDAPVKNQIISHYNAGNMTTVCTLCHGANLKGHAEGGVGPACTDCHVLDPIAYPSRCVSCHGPLPGQQQSGPPLKPLQLAALAGRTDLTSIPTFQIFTSELTARMRRDPSYVRITPSNPHSGFYFKPILQSFTSAANLSNRSSHLHHDALPCQDRQDNATCSICHNDKPNDVRHHSLIFSKGLNCTNCHQITSTDGGFSLGDFTSCRNCHLENFCK